MDAQCSANQSSVNLSNKFQAGEEANKKMRSSGNWYRTRQTLDEEAVQESVLQDSSPPPTVLSHPMVFKSA